jgi:hypothetical protein
MLTDSLRIGYRLRDEAFLHAADADLVVTSLDRVDTAVIADGVLRIGPETRTSFRHDTLSG